MYLSLKQISVGLFFWHKLYEGKLKMKFVYTKLWNDNHACDIFFLPL
jgi:hypothetical protein